MIAWWWMLVGLSAGTMFGFVLCAMFTVSARADELARLRHPGWKASGYDN